MKKINESYMIMNDFKNYINEAKLSDFKIGDRVVVTKRDDKAQLSPGQKGTVDSIGSGPKFNLITIDTDDTISKILGLPFISPSKLRKIK